MNDREFVDVSQIGPCEPVVPNLHPTHLATSAQKSMPLPYRLQQSPGADFFIGWARSVSIPEVVTVTVGPDLSHMIALGLVPSNHRQR